LEAVPRIRPWANIKSGLLAHRGGRIVSARRRSTLHHATRDAGVGSSAYHHAAAMTDDEREALRRISRRRQRAESDWRAEVRRLFEAGHSIEDIAAAAGVRYDVILAIVRR